MHKHYYNITLINIRIKQLYRVLTNKLPLCIVSVETQPRKMTYSIRQCIQKIVFRIDNIKRACAYNPAGIENNTRLLESARFLDCMGRIAGRPKNARQHTKLKWVR